MLGKLVRSLLLGLLLLGLALVTLTACGPASETGSAGSYPAPASATETGGVVSDGVSEGQTEPSSPITSGMAVTGAQTLNWGDDAGNCIMPGLVITGSNADLPPCGTEAGGSEAAESEAATPGTQQQEESMPEDTPSPEPESGETPQPQGQDAHAQRMTALAVDDLSQRLGIPPDEIEVGDVREVTWPDSSLGCPQPDMMYAQMLQEGLLIQLHAGGEMYSYHSGGDQQPFLCEEDFQQPPASR